MYSIISWYFIFVHSRVFFDVASISSHHQDSIALGPLATPDPLKVDPEKIKLGVHSERCRIAYYSHHIDVTFQTGQTTAYAAEEFSLT